MWSLLCWWSWTSSVILYLQFHWNGHVSLFSLVCVSEEAGHPGWNRASPSDGGKRCGKMLYTHFFPWFLTSEDDLKLIKIIDLSILLSSSRSMTTLASPHFLCLGFQVFLQTFHRCHPSTQHENTDISATWGRRGGCYKLCRHMSLFCKKTEESHFNSRAASTKRGKSVQMPACLPWTWKNGIVEIENDLGRMRHICGDFRTQSSWILFVPILHYSASAVDPLSFASFLCWATSEISNFRRQMMSSNLWIGRLLTFVSLARVKVQGLSVCQGWLHVLPSLNNGEVTG